MTSLKDVNILIAGGSGFLGRKCEDLLSKRGARVFLLTRKPKRSNEIYWNPQKGEIDRDLLGSIQVLINLSGENIGSERWTTKRIKELDFSRIGTTEFLANYLDDFSTLEYFICASGINAYGWDTGIEHPEEDSFGKDYLSSLSERWESAADQFSRKVSVCKLRIAPVLAKEAGILPAMLNPILKGYGAVLGSGKQFIPWIHSYDLTQLVAHCIEGRLSGIYNANAGQATNENFTLTLAKVWEKKIRFPKIPAFILKLMLGKRSVLVLKGTKASNQKIKDTNFHFKFEDLEIALRDIKSGS